MRTFLLALLTFITMGTVHAAPELKFKDIYTRLTAKGVERSPPLARLNGKTVEMNGYMAPPLKPKLDFFVLTRDPLAVCPFCTSASEWPPDIVMVLMPENVEIEATTRPLRVTGRLEVGIKRDEATGFVSLVRLYAERVQLK